MIGHILYILITASLFLALPTDLFHSANPPPGTVPFAELSQPRDTEPSDPIDEDHPFVILRFSKPVRCNSSSLFLIDNSLPIKVN